MLNVETIAEHYAEAESIEKLNLDWKETVIVQTLFVYKAIKSFWIVDGHFKSVWASSFLRFDTGLEQECSLEHGWE